MSRKRGLSELLYSQITMKKSLAKQKKEAFCSLLCLPIHWSCNVSLGTICSLYGFYEWWLCVRWCVAEVIWKSQRPPACPTAANWPTWGHKWSIKWAGRHHLCSHTGTPAWMSDKRPVQGAEINRGLPCAAVKRGWIPKSVNGCYSDGSVSSVFSSRRIKMMRVVCQISAFNPSSEVTALKSLTLLKWVCHLHSMPVLTFRNYC